MSEYESPILKHCVKTETVRIVPDNDNKLVQVWKLNIFLRPNIVDLYKKSYSGSALTALSTIFSKYT